MTSTAGTDEHPDVAEISAFAEGLLPPERAADLRDHLELCVLCADVRDSLSEIREVLGTLPGPPRMPEDVAGRIDAALAAEALIQATAADPDRTCGPDPDPGTARPLEETTAGTQAAPGNADPAEPPLRVTRPVGASRMAGVPRGGDVSRETSRAPAGRAGATGPGRATRRSRRRWRALTAACAVAVLGAGGALVHALDDGGPAGTPAAGTFSGERLPVRVHQMLGDTARSASPRTGPQAGRNTPFATRTPNVPACVRKATRRSDGPIAATRGSYDGHAAYLLLLPDRSDPADVDAYVVDAGCTAHSGAAVGTVLARHTYARH